ncbi:MAG: hypothetical protein HOO96_41570 [Polyangiaceae bacterium]|nr:hypothetical protein [Polyangiaceae bacterium]
MGEVIRWPKLGKEPSRWIWGPAADLILICGVGSLAFALLGGIATVAWRPSADLIVIGFLHFGVLCNYPHYAATYSLVVRERHENPRAFRALLLAAAVMAGVVVVGVFRPAIVLRPLTTLYLCWSAHHYAAQHFGVAAMYSHRRGAPLSGAAQRLARFAFLAVGVFLMLSLLDDGRSPQAVDDLRSVPLQVLTGVGYPLALGVGTIAILAFVAGHFVARKERGRGFDAMVWVLFGTNVAWFILPRLRLPGTTVPWTGDLAVWLPYAIPFFHCTQYLAVCGWRERTRSEVRPVYWFMALVAVGLVLFEGIARMLPHVSSLDEAGAFILVPAALNVHHFWVDGRIWRRGDKKPSTTSRAPSPLAA